jgi:hypothetical protein
VDAKKTEIAFSIAPDGTVTFEVKGVKGPDCLELTKEIEEELGVVVSRQNTSEYYEAPVEQDEVVSLEES